MQGEVDFQALRTHKSDTKRLTDGLRKLYVSGRLEPIQSRYSKARSAVVRAYQTAFPDDFPYSHLADWLLGSKTQPPLYIVPSLMAQSPAHFVLPLPDRSPPLRVSVVPMGAEGIPDAVDAALTRYGEVAFWVLEPIFRRYSLEMEELARTRQSLEPQLIWAIALNDLENEHPELVEEIHERYRGASFVLIPAFEEGIRRWEALRSRFPTLEPYFPELLEQGFSSVRGKSALPRLEDPGFEDWDGVVLRHWSTEVIEPALESPKPSTVARVPGIKHGPALMLAGDSGTNQWLGVASQPTAVQAGDRVNIRAYMRANHVAPLGSRIRAAHIEARVTNLEGALLRRVSGREFLGTTGWEAVDIDFVVPATARYMQIACVLAMTGELYFDNIVMNVERASVWRFLRRNHFARLKRRPLWSFCVSFKLSNRFSLTLREVI
jgi:hypothetical protein